MQFRVRGTVRRGKFEEGRKGREALLLATTAMAIFCGVSGGLAQTAPALPTAQSQQQNTPRAFNIPAQPLTSAVSAFGRQSGLQVTLSSETSRNVSTNAVIGSFSPDQALRQLLAGTGITYRITPNRIAIIGAEKSVSGAPVTDGSTVLETIKVTAKGARSASSGSGYQGTPDWVYETPASVSVVSREAIQNAPVRNARDLLDTVAGVYVNRSEGQNPGIAVNIRGLQDQNRVVTMIDGARQNFQRNGHGASQRTYVDTSFVREIDVEKTGTSGVGGAGSLGGSVNFRTIIADDLIAPGKQWGAELNASTGTNAFQFDGSASAAFRVSDSFSFLGGISKKKVGAYKIGKNGEIKISPLFNDGDALLFTGQEVLSTLFKAEAEVTDDVKFTLGWLRNGTESSQGSWSAGVIDEDIEKVVNNTVTANLDWDPDSELIDLKARLWYNHLKNHETRGFVLDPDVSFPIEYSLGTVGISLENTSRFETPLGLLSLNYGVEAFHDNGKTEVDSEYLASAYGSNGGTDYSIGFSGTNPNGKRDMASAFLNATLEHDDWLTVSGGMRYDHYNISGSAVIYGNAQTTTIRTCVLYFPDGSCRRYTTTNTTTYPSETIDVDRSGGAFVPTAMIAVKPFDWLQPFARYSQSYRPPSIMEALFAGGHPPPALPINYAPNTDLQAESAETFEIGANISQDGILSADDSFRMKAVAFYRQIEDYIALGTVYRPETGKSYGSWVNVDGTTRMKGVEIEGNYDAGPYYLGASFTWMDTDFADSYTYQGTSYVVEPSVIFVPPKTKVTVDAGVRLFEEKLTLGGRITHVGGTEPSIGLLTASYITDDYTVYDLYGSYKFNETATLRFAVNNVADLAYVPALGAKSLPAAGRTLTASLNFKF